MRRLLLTSTARCSGAAGSHIPDDRRQLVAKLLAESGLDQLQISITGAGAANLAAAMQVGAQPSALCTLLAQPSAILPPSCTCQHLHGCN
jgi:hypothetical protein